MQRRRSPRFSELVARRQTQLARWAESNDKFKTISKKRMRFWNSSSSKFAKSQKKVSSLQSAFLLGNWQITCPLEMAERRKSLKRSFASKYLELWFLMRSFASNFELFRGVNHYWDIDRYFAHHIFSEAKVSNEAENVQKRNEKSWRRIPIRDGRGSANQISTGAYRSYSRGGHVRRQRELGSSGKQWSHRARHQATSRSKQGCNRVGTDWRRHFEQFAKRSRNN